MPDERLSAAQAFADNWCQGVALLAQHNMKSEVILCLEFVMLVQNTKSQLVT